MLFESYTNEKNLTITTNDLFYCETKLYFVRKVLTLLNDIYVSYTEWENCTNDLTIDLKRIQMEQNLGKNSVEKITLFFSKYENCLTNVFQITADPKLQEYEQAVDRGLSKLSEMLNP